MISRRFSEIVIGERFGDSLGVTDWHLLTASGLFYDFGPNHSNADHSASNRFGGRIAQGFLTTGMMMGVVGRYFGYSIEAFLESKVRFLAPVLVNESIAILWQVESLQTKEAFGGGLIDLRGWCWAGDPERLAVDMSARLAINDEPGPGLHSLPVESQID